MSAKLPPVAPPVLIPAEGTEREELIAMLRGIRCEGLPKIASMMQRLEREAHTAKRDTARVAAARVYLRNTLEATQLLYEIEQGAQEKRSGGPSIQILVAAPGGDARAPTEVELKAILTEVSDSVIKALPDA